MDNNTGIEVGDFVTLRGGFEEGMTGWVSDIDLSGEVRNWPRFTITCEGKTIGGNAPINVEALRLAATAHDLYDLLTEEARDALVIGGHDPLWLAQQVVENPTDKALLIRIAKLERAEDAPS